MMRHLGIDISVEMPKAKVIEIVKRNRDQHAEIIEEARLGYVVAMQERLVELKREFYQLQPDAPLPRLQFPSAPPAGHLHVFDSALRLLESHMHDTITLNADAHRNLIENEWEWSREFLAQAIAYSGTAQEAR